MSVLNKFRSSDGGRVREFVYKGEQFKFSSKGSGDLYFASLYPDPTVGSQKCKHHAVVNGRIEPYPLAIWGDVIAILGTWGLPGEVPDESVVFEMYDSEPALFGMMRASAMEVLGVDAGAGASGFAGWQNVYRLALELKALKPADPESLGSLDDWANMAALCDALRRASVEALKEWRVDLSGVVSPEDLAAASDPVLEAIRGN